MNNSPNNDYNQQVIHNERLSYIQAVSRSSRTYQEWLKMVRNRADFVRIDPYPMPVSPRNDNRI